MKRLVIKEVKRQVQHLDKALEYGMQHRLILIQLQLLVMKRQLTKNQQEEIVGTKHPKLNEKRLDIIVAGLKHQKRIEFKVME